MNVLIVGAGGREHALAYAFAKSASVTRVYAAPGNAGMENHAECVDIAETDEDSLVAFAKDRLVELTVIGPEATLLAGLADRFEQEGLRVFGPKKKAAMIEGSKTYAKEVMERYHIPTGTYASFSKYNEAEAYVRRQGTPIVIKADGLAAGKGVTVAMTEEEALKALEEVLKNHKFGEAGAEVVIEEFLEGEELSLMAFVHGETVVPMVAAQDHKRAYNNDEGPNTGGMGAYSPVPQFTQKDIDEAVEKVLQPAASGLRQEGSPFTGVLYAGLMMTSAGPKVIEFNARFGDPEAQVVLPRLESDLAQLLITLLEGEKPEPVWSEEAVLGVVAASKGYPGSYEKNHPIQQVPESPLLFFAGVEKKNGIYVNSGGRVLLLSEKAATLAEAQEKVYEKLNELDTGNLFYRTDIGFRALR
ncbi:phosphoribosylamine--glycine ligase [Marinococcus halophilus]|uniref:Phosphoribosylamine--glycine ligase n=1 Tax=Marinococcus halophilus TaxID=1371 RepID=A0A510Y7K7_MARHA|nr:phosphoribosylamine--glycine ligase [Marinococcus halophilus]OZT79849.1 phosphoribosylamine--glycine ligase [Marinococcus halophilus]GEK58671.1 phosphoribosylamine--glycine ligase [Marinococcus halophilus]